MATDDSPLTQVDGLARPYVRHLTDADGLPQNSVQALARDRRGYLWIGTQDGTAYYNGRRWTVVNLPKRARSNNVRALLTSSDGSVWFGTIGGGLARLGDGTWTLFDSSEALPHNDVRCLLETGSETAPTIWVGTTPGGLARFDGRGWRTYDETSGLPGNGVASLTETVESGGKRLLWAGTIGGGLACFDGRWWSSYGLPCSQPDRVNALSLLEGTHDSGARVLWVGSPSGLFPFDLEQRRFLPPAAVPEAAVFSLLRTRGRFGDVLWAGTGVARLHRVERGRVRTYDPQSGLPAGRIFSLLEAAGPEHYGAIWVGTDAGLALLDEHGWWTLDEESGLPNKVAWALAEVRSDRGSRTICIGTDGGGAALLEPEGWTVCDTATGLPSDVVWALAETPCGDGPPTLRVGTELGLASRGEGRWEILDQTQGLPHSGIRALAVSVEPGGGTGLWIATPQGISRLARGTLMRYDGSSGLPVQGVWSLLETSDAGGPVLWVGSRGGGLARYGNGRWEVFDTSSGLPSNVILCLHESRGSGGEATLWVGTSAGVAYRSLLRPEAGWVVFDDSTAPALPNNTVYRISEDACGRLYFATNKGVARLTRRPASSDDDAEFSIRNFTMEDGLPSNECNAGASLVDSLGRVWVGTVEGVAYFDPAREVDDRTPKPLHVERVRLNGREVDLAGRGPLSHVENNLEFEYALLSFRREGDTRYRTQLAGFDREPSGWTADYRRNYTNLPRGDYEFRVWGRDAFGNVSGPVTISFRVRPAPWRTWWAYTLYAGAIAGAAYGGSRYRIRSLQQRGEELQALVNSRTAELASTVEQLRESEQRAREANRAKSVFLSNMSHELRTPLNAVIGLAGLLERDGSLAAEQREMLETIARSGEHLLELINDVLSLSKIEAGKIALRVEPFDLAALLRGLEAMTRLRAETKGIEILFDLRPSLPRAVLGDEGKLRQVLINLLGNAVKFTERGRVELRARWDGARAAFEVEDTGCGIASEEIDRLFHAFEQTESGLRAQEGTGLGLAISRQIVRMMGGDIWVRSEPGVGSTFGFDVDLPAAGAVAVRPARRVLRLAPSQPLWKVLVADDTPENRLALARLLALVGFDVREAANGSEAVAVWRTWRPHLVWMDVRMPVLDGIEATRLIRTDEADGGRRRLVNNDLRTESEVHRSSFVVHCSTKILALTASVFEHEREAMFDAGADDFVVKPFRESTIFDKLAEHLGVRYEYDEASAARAAEPEEVLTPNRVAALPPALASAVHDALFVGDADAALEAVEEIRRTDGALAEELAHRIRGFQFSDVLALFTQRS